MAFPRIQLLLTHKVAAIGAVGVVGILIVGGIYLAHFNKVVETKQRLGLDENSGLEGTLRKSVHEIETKLKDFDEPKLLVTMLMMRRHEKDFMLRRSVKYGDDMKKRGTEFIAG